MEKQGTVAAKTGGAAAVIIPKEIVMRCAVIYSSLTGNTRMVAEAIRDAMPQDTAIYPVAQAPDPGSFDFLALGFWADKGKVDLAMQAYMEKTTNKGIRIGLFGTLGAYPDSDHGRNFMADARERVTGNTVLGDFLCMGKVDPKLLKTMETMRQKGDSVHPMTTERAARIAEGAKHPDNADLAAAKAKFTKILRKADEHKPA